MSAVQILGCGAELDLFPLSSGELVHGRARHFHVALRFWASIHDGRRAQCSAGAGHLPGLDASLLLRVAHRTHQTLSCCASKVIMPALRNRAGRYIFVLWFLLPIFYLSVFFPRLFSAVAG